MIGVERQQQIVDALARKPFLSGTELARMLRVSRVTIHRDMQAVVERGLARRVRGGLARIEAPPAASASFNERRRVLAAEKDRIGAAAARLVRNGETIIMDGGTTTSSMAPYLVGKQIKVITNSLTVADYLCDHSHNDVIVVGGSLYRGSKVLLGLPAQQTLRQLNAHKTFVSAGGVTLEGIGHSDSMIVETEKLMIARGQEVILLLDHTKFASGATMTVCPWAKISKIITDRPVPEKFAAFFKRRKIIVIIAL